MTVRGCVTSRDGGGVDKGEKISIRKVGWCCVDCCIMRLGRSFIRNVNFLHLFPSFSAMISMKKCLYLVSSAGCFHFFHEF